MYEKLDFYGSIVEYDTPNYLFIIDQIEIKHYLQFKSFSQINNKELHSVMPHVMIDSASHLEAYRTMLKWFEKTIKSTL